MQPRRVVGQGGAGGARLLPRWPGRARGDGGAGGRGLRAPGRDGRRVQESALFPHLAQERRRSAPAGPRGLCALQGPSWGRRRRSRARGGLRGRAHSRTPRTSPGTRLARALVRGRTPLGRSRRGPGGSRRPSRAASGSDWEGLRPHRRAAHGRPASPPERHVEAASSGVGQKRPPRPQAAFPPTSPPLPSTPFVPAARVIKTMKQLAATCSGTSVLQTREGFTSRHLPPPARTPGL